VIFWKHVFVNCLLMTTYFLDNFLETKLFFHLGYFFQIIPVRTISDIIFGDINESNLQVLINEDFNESNLVSSY
jgi:hypothetical protein